MKTGKSLQELAAEIERRALAKRDLVTASGHINLSPRPDGTVKLTIAEDAQSYDISKTTHDQLGAYAGIPAKYYDKMLAEMPHLLATNVNAWLANAPREQRMIRTLDGRVRAFLSDRYERLDNEQLAETVFPIARDLGLEPMSMEITEARLYLKFVDPAVGRALKAKGASYGDRTHTIVRVVAPAVTISNSEIGLGALTVKGGYYDSHCSNLASFGERSTRKYHVGAKHDLVSDESFALLSQEARTATNKAKFLQVRDLVKVAFDRAKFDELIDKVDATQEDKIEGPLPKVVELAAAKFGMTENEGASVLRHLAEGGSLTRFGLLNAITRTAQDLADYDRATQFEEMGGKIVELPKTEWHALNKAS